MNKKKKILVVDDEPDILRLVSFRLKVNGYNVMTAQDGASGMELIKKSRPDLILLDLKLPDMDGGQFCRKIKTNQSLKDIPIIFLTASVLKKVIDSKKENQADDYIIKPFEVEDLLAKIDKYIK